MKIDLKRLILFLALVSLLLTLSNALFASFRVQKTSLIQGSLESNYAYATKIASSVEDFLVSAQQQLGYSSRILSNHFHDIDFLKEEARRIKQQTSSFNSVVIANNEGVVLATDPGLGLVGRQLQSKGSELALSERKPIISPPFTAQTGRLLITMSYPVFDSLNVYLGYISATIYLHEKSVLNRLIGRHFHRDGSYVYVVDDAKRLIFHPDPSRIGDVIKGNSVIDDVVAGNSGAMQLFNSQGIEMVAGYAHVPNAGWGIVSQRPLEATLAPLNELITQVLLNALPVTVLIVLLIVFFVRIIAKPLRRLAESAATMDRPETTQEIENTPAWYFETEHLKKALLAGIMLMQRKINRLHIASETDPLTGLANRRGYNSALNIFMKTHQSIAIIAIDIDHFKRINDTYGHDVGDLVLKELAAVMLACSRREDVVCRVGGEEFLILIPEAKLDFVHEMAERLRCMVAQKVFEHVGHVTVSLGVALWPDCVGDIGSLAKLADEMLYNAKKNGRNRVEVALLYSSDTN